VNRHHVPIAFPCVDDFRIGDPVNVRLMIEKVEHVLYSEREGVTSLHSTEDGLEKVVHVLLYRALLLANADLSVVRHKTNFKLRGTRLLFNIGDILAREQCFMYLSLKEELKYQFNYE